MKGRIRPFVEQLEGRLLPSITLANVGVWTERGPGPIDHGQVDVNGSSLDDPVAGAVEALAPDPSNKDILYAGTVNGGVWKTNFAYTRDPEWIPLTDQFPSLSIGALGFSPMDATNNTLFAGIGGTSNNGRSGGPLTGILRTTDGGASWQQLGSGLAGLKVESVVPTQLGGDPAHQVVLAAAHDWSGFDPASSGSAGIYRSTDGGATFQLVLAGTAPLADCRTAPYPVAAPASRGTGNSQPSFPIRSRTDPALVHVC